MTYPKTRAVKIELKTLQLYSKFTNKFLYFIFIFLSKIIQNIKKHNKNIVSISKPKFIDKKLTINIIQSNFVFSNS